MGKLFVINPSATREKNSGLLSRLKELFPDATVRITEKKDDDKQFVIESKDDEIIGVGGDGTFKNILDGVYEREDRPVIGIIPSGSGNDFARYIYGREISPEETLKGIADSSIKPLKCDVGKTNHGYFINIASVGFDAEIVKNSERYKNKPLLRKFSYILSIFYTVFKFKGVDISMDIDGEKTSQKMLLMAIANGQYYGGGIRIAPTADMFDGYFDVIYIPIISPWRVCSLLPKLLNGSHIKTKYVNVIKGRRIHFESENEVLFNMDGELQNVKSVDLEIMPKDISVYGIEKQGENK